MKPIDILGLKNFRVFDGIDGFWEEFSSINILTGANNSGKSSIVKALQLLKNSVKESKYPFDLDLNNQEHLLGDFDNILHDKNNRKVDVTLPFLFLGMKNLFINLTFEAPKSQNSYKAKLRGIKVGDKTDKEFLFTFYYRDATDEEKELYNIAFAKEVEDYKQKKSEYSNAENDVFSINEYLFAPTENPLSGYIEWRIDFEKLKGYLVDLLKFYEIYLKKKKEWDADSFEWADDVAKDMYIIPSSVVRSFKGNVDIEKWKDFIENKIGIGKETGQEHVGEHDYDSEDFYIPPYETENILFYKVSSILKENLKWNDSDGENSNYSVIDHCFSSSWDNVIQRLSNINYVSNIKEENSRSYNASSNSPFVNLLKNQESSDFLDTKFVKKYLKAFEIGKKISLEFNPKYQSILVSITTLEGDKRELVDFGYGIKQVILILIQISVLSQKNKSLEHRYDYDGEYLKERYELSLLIVEEPESNLHPKWQSLLAEMFVEANRDFNIQLVIETHSEYLIRKFQTLVADNRIKGKDVKIFYLRPFKKGSDSKKQVESFYIQDDGSIDFNIFDSGFFDENYNLNLSLLNIQRDKFFKEFEDLKNAHQESEDKIHESVEKIQENENKITLLQQKIDEFTNKSNLSVYQQIIDSRYDVSKISPLSVNYLVSGEFLLENIQVSGDFSPVIIQYGRAIENELKQIFLTLSPTKKWMIGKMQGSLEKLINGTTTIPDTCNATEFTQLPLVLTNMFRNYTNLRYDLINDLREIRNSASHAGHTKTKQEAIDYIQNAQDFLVRWVAEMK